MSNHDPAAPENSPINDLDRVIHEPARLLILGYLSAVKSADFLFLMRQTGLTKGNLSSHLSKLEAEEYIEIQKEFVDKIPRTQIRLTSRGRKAFQVYREAMRQFIEDFPKG